MSQISCGLYDCMTLWAIEWLQDHKWNKEGSSKPSGRRELWCKTHTSVPFRRWPCAIWGMWRKETRWQIQMRKEGGGRGVFEEVRLTDRKWRKHSEHEGTCVLIFTEFVKTITAEEWQGREDPVTHFMFYSFLSLSAALHDASCLWPEFLGRLMSTVGRTASPTVTSGTRVPRRADTASIWRRQWVSSCRPPAIVWAPRPAMRLWAWHSQTLLLSTPSLPPHPQVPAWWIRALQLPMSLSAPTPRVSSLRFPPGWRSPVTKCFSQVISRPHQRMQAQRATSFLLSRKTVFKLMINLTNMTDFPLKLSWYIFQWQFKKWMNKSLLSDDYFGQVKISCVFSELLCLLSWCPSV